jgi:hypothetical protein
MSPRRSPREGGRAAGGPSGPTDPRRLALQALAEIDDGGFANIVVPALLGASGMSERDRAFTTTLVYGTTRMRRALDLLVDRFVLRELDGPTRNALRLGAHQLHHLGTPPHAAVSATVAVAPQVARAGERACCAGRRGAGHVARRRHPAELPGLGGGAAGRGLSDEPTRMAALEQMNEPAACHRPRRRLHPGPGVAVGGGGRRGRCGRAGRRPLRRPRWQGDVLASTGAHVLASDLARPGWR